jgi:hypothetical protein
MSDNNMSDNTSIIDQSVPSSMTNSLHLSETSETSETLETLENSSKNIDILLDDLNTDMSHNKDIMEMSCIEPEVSESVSDSEEDESESVSESVSDSEEDDSESESVSEESESVSEESESESDSEESESDGEEDKIKNSFQIILLKEHHNEFPWSIRCVGYILIVMYIIKLFIALCMLSGCNCPRNCICLS